MAFNSDPFFCSFCGKEFEKVGLSGRVKGGRPIAFKSPFHGCQTLIACKTCSSKYKGKEADQFFCNFCGKQIKVTESKTAIDRKEGAAVFVPSCEKYGYYTTILVCLDGEQRDTDGWWWRPTSIHKEFIFECVPCQACGLLISIHAGSDEGECSNCGTYISNAGEYKAPALFEELR